MNDPINTSFESSSSTMSCHTMRNFTDIIEKKKGGNSIKFSFQCKCHTLWDGENVIKNRFATFNKMNSSLQQFCLQPSESKSFRFSKYALSTSHMRRRRQTNTCQTGRETSWHDDNASEEEKMIHLRYVGLASSVATRFSIKAENKFKYDYVLVSRKVSTLFSPLRLLRLLSSLQNVSCCFF